MIYVHLCNMNMFPDWKAYVVCGAAALAVLAVIVVADTVVTPTCLSQLIGRGGNNVCETRIFHIAVEAALPTAYCVARFGPQYAAVMFISYVVCARVAKDLWAWDGATVTFCSGRSLRLCTGALLNDAWLVNNMAVLCAVLVVLVCVDRRTAPCLAPAIARHRIARKLRQPVRTDPPCTWYVRNDRLERGIRTAVACAAVSVLCGAHGSGKTTAAAKVLGGLARGHGHPGTLWLDGRQYRAGWTVCEWIAHVIGAPVPAAMGVHELFPPRTAVQEQPRGAVPPKPPRPLVVIDDLDAAVATSKADACVLVRELSQAACAHGNFAVLVLVRDATLGWQDLMACDRAKMASVACLATAKAETAGVCAVLGAPCTHVHAPFVWSAAELKAVLDAWAAIRRDGITPCNRDRLAGLVDTRDVTTVMQLRLAATSSVQVRVDI